jgi:hypothetical protein
VVVFAWSATMLVTSMVGAGCPLQYLQYKGNEPLGTATCKQPLVGGPPRPGRPAVHHYTKAYYARALCPSPTGTATSSSHLTFQTNGFVERLGR